MKKGDERREQIIETAERLFYENGYENTSIQMILDAMRLSKGGFYHHFDSKLSLLEAICVRRATGAYAELEEIVGDVNASAIDKLNALLGISGIFDQDDDQYISLMLKVAYKEGSVMLRERMKEASMDKAVEYADYIINQGIREKSFFTPYREDIGRLILMLGNNMTDEIARAMVIEMNEEDAISRIVTVLGVYRHAVEKLLDAPFGSIIAYNSLHIVNIFRKLKGTGEIPAFDIA